MRFDAFFNDPLGGYQQGAPFCPAAAAAAICSKPTGRRCKSLATSSIRLNALSPARSVLARKSAVVAPIWGAQCRLENELTDAHVLA